MNMRRLFTYLNGNRLSSAKRKTQTCWNNVISNVGSSVYLRTHMSSRGSQRRHAQHPPEDLLDTSLST
eukprot:4959297-Amphidinium_carterae.1